MLKIVAGKVKRVWVVDEKEVPIGVVTLTDIISKFGPQDVTLIRPAEKTLRR
jgi:signal-transduction protein with cAMP-binding, CBS, and nucleotidyltransferase domain